MRVPLSWLRDYVDVDLTPEQLADRLTLLGMEVQGIERIGDAWHHVVVGELLEVAPHPNSSRLSLTRVRVGEQVSVNPNVDCLQCDYCRSGRPILCPNLRGYGCQVNGFFAEYAVVNEQQVFSVDGIPVDTAVFAEPAACATHGLENLKVRPGSSALVFGSGPTGMLLAQLLRSGGATSVTTASASNGATTICARCSTGCAPS